MKRVLSNQSGIALMIVLAAITILTAVATEFAYNTNVNYHLALNEKERLQAYFLAESAIKLMELELKLEKQLRSTMSSSAAAGMIVGNLSGPLCQQFPLSTGLIRGMFLGQPLEGEAGEEGGEGGEAAAFISGMQVDAAKEFLDFEGDFEGGCEDESAKFNLNMFAGKEPGQQVLSGYNSYDKVKLMLISLLSRPEFTKLFPEDDKEKVGELARNIADWVDKNESINELGATTTGSESSLYPAGIAEYGVKNGKYLTLDEIYMVAGVADDWFTPIKNRFTIYGGDKLNVCLAGDEMIAALIVQYANTSPNIPDVNPGDKQRMKILVDVVKNGCMGVNPNVSEIAAALDAALGVAGAAVSGGTASDTTGGTASGATGGFADLITTESRYYSLVGTGVVGDTEVRIKAVLDTKEAQPNRWKFVYWRVE